MTSTMSPPLCLDCGHACRPGAQFCPRCGSRQPLGAAPADAGAGRAAGPGSFAAQGQVRQNQTYVGNRLMYTRGGSVESSFLNVVTGRMVWGHLKRVLVTQAVVWVLAAIVTVPLQVQEAASAAVGEDGGGLAFFLRMIFLFLSVGLLVTAFTGQVQEPMSEWELLLDERSVSGDAAYAAIAGALQRRQVPALVYAQQIVKDTPSRTTGNHLVVRDDPYVVYVSVVPFGTGLYLSWTMWREQSVGRLYGEWFRQVRNRRAGTGTLLHHMLRAEDARALRETVHNAVRDGVETAIAGQQVSLETAFGGRVPPVTTASATTPSSSIGAPLPLMPPLPPLPPMPPAPGGRP
ncbi:hypothetical protein [Geodermatophilus sp. SYSU D01105]